MSEAKTNDGGACFPHQGFKLFELPGKSEEKGVLSVLPEAGMSQRTLIAMVAMHAMIVHGDTDGRDPKYLSMQSFAIADAMLARREKGGAL